MVESSPLLFADELGMHRRVCGGCAPAGNRCPVSRAWKVFFMNDFILVLPRPSWQQQKQLETDLKPPAAAEGCAMHVVTIPSAQHYQMIMMIIIEVQVGV